MTTFGEAETDDPNDKIFEVRPTHLVAICSALCKKDVYITLCDEAGSELYTAQRYTTRIHRTNNESDA